MAFPDISPLRTFATLALKTFLFTTVDHGGDSCVPPRFLRALGVKSLFNAKPPRAPSFAKKKIPNSSS
jgi:hypothetical protein